MVAWNQTAVNPLCHNNICTLYAQCLLSFGIFVECDAEALSVNLECESTEYGSSIENPCPFALLVFSIRAKTLRNVPLDYFQAQKCLSVGRMGRTLVKLTLLFIREGAKPDSGRYVGPFHSCFSSPASYQF